MPDKLFENIESRCRDILSKRISRSSLIDKLVSDLYRGALNGKELSKGNLESQLKWFENRLKTQLIWIDKDDYTKALVRGLWLAPTFAATDYGGSRQRDFAQVWTDTARGFMGEIALQKFFKKISNVEVGLDLMKGSIDKFLPSDIKVKDADTNILREPKRLVSIKTTKFNGRWLDLPGAQFDHSDIFILVKLGISRFHFSGYLKDSGFLKDNLLKKAKNLHELDQESIEKLLKDTPSFSEIPAYITGFLEKKGLNLPIHEFNCRKRGRTNIRITIDQGIGLFSRSILRENSKILAIDPSCKLPFEIEPIISALTDSKHFLANSGALSFGEDKWKKLAESL